MSSVILYTIGLMATRSPLILVTALSVRILLECFLVTSYRPQGSWAKVIFSQVCVKNSVHRGGRVSASVHAGIHHQPPSGADPPKTRHPLGADPPGSRPLEQTPREQTHTPGTSHPPGTRPPTRHPPGADPPEQTPPSRSRHHHPCRSRLQHTVNERPVRILLECILVLNRVQTKLDNHQV